MDLTLDFATFNALQGAAFSVVFAPEETLELRLESATDLGSGSQEAHPRMAAPQWERFSLLFRGPRSHFLPQATYEFAHPTLGSFPMFIVPIGADDLGFRYEAAFNRRLQPGLTTP